MLPSGSGATGSFQQAGGPSSGGPAGAQTQGQQALGGDYSRRNSVVIKVGMVGDAQIGKTSLMVKYVEGSFDEDYIQTLGRPKSRHFPHLLLIPPPEQY